MSTYPISVWAFSDGTWVSAAYTDQAHWSLEKAKHVGTVTIVINDLTRTRLELERLRAGDPGITQSQARAIL